MNCFTLRNILSTIDRLKHAVSKSKRGKILSRSSKPDDHGRLHNYLIFKRFLNAQFLFVKFDGLVVQQTLAFNDVNRY